MGQRDSRTPTSSSSSDERLEESKSRVDRREHTRVEHSEDVDLIDDSINRQENEAFITAKILSLSPRGLSVIFHKAIPEAGAFIARFRIPPNGWVRANVRKVWGKKETSGHVYGFVFTKLRAVDYRAILGLRSQVLVSDERRRTHRREERNGGLQGEKRSKIRRWSLPTYPLFINGRDVYTEQYAYFPFMDKLISEPKATREILSRLGKNDIPLEAADYVYARACVGSEAHNKAAITFAAEAFKSFSTFSLLKRTQILNDIQNLTKMHKGKLLDLFVAEGHPRQLGEWEFSGMLKTYARESVSFYRSEIARKFKDHAGETTMLLRKPDGVVCVSPPRNASCSNSILGGFALLGGNTVVIKPPLSLPIATIYLWRQVINEALRINGAPAGTVNIVLGNTIKFINEWIKNPQVNDVIYFGNSDRGLEIGHRIFNAGKKPILELSGKDILLIWSDADLKAAADSLADCFLGSTQICMVPKMALIHEDCYEAFKEIFIERIKQLKVGLPSDPATCLSPVNKITTFFEFMQDALSAGARRIYGGQRLNHFGESDNDGIYIEPTLLEIDADENIGLLRCIKEENFFPLLPLVRVSRESFNDLARLPKSTAVLRAILRLVEQNSYGLRVSAWCRSDSIIRRLVREIRNCGLLRINCRHVDFSLYLATHGGIGKSGGPFGEMNYFWQKTSHLQGVTIKRSA